MVIYCKDCKNRCTEKCPMCCFESDSSGTLYCLADNTYDYGFCYLGEEKEENGT